MEEVFVNNWAKNLYFRWSTGAIMTEFSSYNITNLARTHDFVLTRQTLITTLLHNLTYNIPRSIHLFSIILLLILLTWACSW